ncbi:DUF1871 family protein [Alkalibacillus aidingensis]|uniref:DUF1871 family protein n=1 Tax=Alkalibacillus aidingensis TaxID=2747607 RepID=UPI00166082B7|nr:DUF1871 family protein [Alkalibacillus aidingensis]
MNIIVENRQHLSAVIKKVFDYFFDEDHHLEECTKVATRIWNELKHHGLKE